jgi:hypothetical protein
MVIVGRATVAALMLSATAMSAAAQDKEPIGRFVADVRVAFAGYKQESTVATPLGVATLSLPKRGLGLIFGGHVYPVRKGIFALGLGAEWIVSPGSHTIESTTTGVADVVVETHFAAFSPQVSLNFGGRQGWSYLTGGLGSATYTTELQSAPFPTADRVKMINYGGGARWFAKEHLALSLDLRFYVVSPQEATGTRPAFPRARVRVMSVGISLK